jgi:hypothetical protein
MPRPPCMEATQPCSRAEGAEFVRGVHCAVCWKYANRPAFKAFWDRPDVNDAMEPLPDPNPGNGEVTLADLSQTETTSRTRCEFLGNPVVRSEICRLDLPVSSCGWHHCDKGLGRDGYARACTECKVCPPDIGYEPVAEKAALLPEKTFCGV